MEEDNKQERGPALIQLLPSADVELAIRLVEAAGGRILHAYPPHALIVDLAPGNEDRLIGQAGIAAVDREEIRPTRAPMRGESEAVIEAWNAHLAERRSPKKRGGELPWDAPGMLPPHPPPKGRKKRRDGR